MPAFHWMDPDATLAEVARILRPGGSCATRVTRAGSARGSGYRTMRLVTEPYREHVAPTPREKE